MYVVHLQWKSAFSVLSPKGGFCFVVGYTNFVKHQQGYIWGNAFFPGDFWRQFIIIISTFIIINLDI